MKRLEGLVSDKKTQKAESAKMGYFGSPYSSDLACRMSLLNLQGESINAVPELQNFMRWLCNSAQTALCYETSDIEVFLSLAFLIVSDT